MDIEKEIKEIQELVDMLGSRQDREDFDIISNFIKKQKAELEKKEKKISDLEFALMDMVLQFADESKDKIGTMGLSALEIAFGELDFDNPMPIKEVHKRYKKLAQEYYKVEREGK